MRTAVFVDAGYLYFAGAIAVSGEKLRRKDVKLDVPNTLAKLKQTASALTDRRPLLRIYWYDGALARGLSSEHEELADSPDIKLRLGAISQAGRQKGVDSLIVADLIDLARNHAIADAVLLSGDEDTRIGVQIAQSFGVRVHLVGIRVPDGNQSLSLKRESDTTTEWGSDEISGFMTRTRTPDVDADIRGTGDEDLAELAECVAEFVSSCSAKEIADITALGSNEPVPFLLDRQLLRTCSAKLGRQLDEPEKHRARRVLKERARSTRR